MKGKNMKVEKKNLNEALEVQGKVVSQTSPVDVQKSIRFVGDAERITAMATDGIEVISLEIFYNDLCKNNSFIWNKKNSYYIFLYICNLRL